MLFLIGLMTLVMVLDCAVLIFLVLIQLPKKDAGAGLAFGASTSDALFGAGSGTVLTKITKYAAGTFFVLAIVLSIMQSKYHSHTASAFEQKLSAPAPAVPGPGPASAPASSTPGAQPLLSKPAAEATNVPPPAATNAADSTTNAAPPAKQP
jgi:preprotein translocase subunit SecG